jgi:DNA-directed RNA polymerase subunit M/transcription elongation factor TFIIS
MASQSQSQSDSEKIECPHCGKEYKNKYTLKSHLATNKKCMSARASKDDSSNEIESESRPTFLCSSCGHIAMLRTDLQRHLLSCTKYQIDEKMKEKDAEIQQLKREIDEKNKKLDERERQAEEYVAKIDRLTDRLLEYMTQSNDNETHTHTTTHHTTHSSSSNENETSSNDEENERQYIAYVQNILQQINIGQYVQQLLAERARQHREIEDRYESSENENKEENKEENNDNNENKHE